MKKIFFGILLITIFNSFAMEKSSETSVGSIAANSRAQQSPAKASQGNAMQNSKDDYQSKKK